jgi:hypothetical protein
MLHTAQRCTHGPWAVHLISSQCLQAAQHDASLMPSISRSAAEWLRPSGTHVVCWVVRAHAHMYTPAKQMWHKSPGDLVYSIYSIYSIYSAQVAGCVGLLSSILAVICLSVCLPARLPACLSVCLSAAAAVSGPSYGCPRPKDTCSSPGADQTNNFMVSAVWS